MNAYYKGQPIFGPRGPAGPDGNPIGTVISFMGITAPEDYLVCDGAEYSISLYPALASFFEAQFGAKNHFGGDGTATFAVPDMRNLFLRGYRGEAGEQLSGEIGDRQEATEFPNIFNASTSQAYSVASIKTANTGNITASNVDKGINSSTMGRAIVGGTTFSPLDIPGLAKFEKYTAHPVNMAVLYCIKAADTSCLPTYLIL